MASGSPLSSLSSTAPLNTDEVTPEFVNLDDRYKCAICRNILNNPVQTKCGHRLCGTGCVDQLFKDGEPVTCPAADEFCEKLYKKDIYPDVSARREIRNLSVYCPYKDLGCDVTVTWRDLKKHTEKCPLKPQNCPFQAEGCTEKLPQKALELHVEQCGYRRVPCAKCNQTFQHSMSQQHKENDCPAELVACPHRCGVPQMRRGDVKVTSQVARLDSRDKKNAES